MVGSLWAWCLHGGNLESWEDLWSGCSNVDLEIKGFCEAQRAVERRLGESKSGVRRFSSEMRSPGLPGERGRLHALSWRMK